MGGSPAQRHPPPEIEIQAADRPAASQRRGSGAPPPRQTRPRRAQPTARACTASAVHAAPVRTCPHRGADEWGAAAAVRPACSASGCKRSGYWRRVQSAAVRSSHAGPRLNRRALAMPCRSAPSSWRLASSARFQGELRQLARLDCLRCHYAAGRGYSSSPHAPSARPAHWQPPAPSAHWLAHNAPERALRPAHTGAGDHTCDSLPRLRLQC